MQELVSISLYLESELGYVTCFANKALAHVIQVKPGKFYA